MDQAPGRPMPAGVTEHAPAGGRLAIPLCIDGATHPSETRFARLCAYGVIFTTRLLSSELGVELASEYVGYADASARSSHMATSRSHPETGWTTAQHPARSLNVRSSPRACLFDHLQRLQDFLARLGHTVTVELDDASLACLDDAAQTPGSSAPAAA